MLKRNLIFAFSPFLILIFLHSSLLFSQEYSYRHYTVKDGLVQNQVITMFQDSKGYIWLCTKGGVSRFDGNKFKNLTVNDGLLSNQIVRILEDSEGGINFSSIIGISRLYQGKITTVLLTDTIKSKKNNLVLQNFITKDICFLSSSNLPIYIGPVNSRISRLFNDLDSIMVSYFILEDNYNKLWLRTFDYGLYCITNDTLLCYADGLKGILIKDKTGKVLFCADNCLYVPDTLVHKLNKIYCFEGEEVYILNDFDPENHALFQVEQKYIVEFDGQEEKKYLKKFNYINILLTDNEDNLWIATETGLYRKISDAFENFTTETGANEYVWSIVEDDQKNIWFASYGDGLCKWDGENISRITEYTDTYSSVPTNYFYTGAILASNRNLYFPIKENGILQYNSRDFSVLQGLPKGSVLDVYEDSSNHCLLVASTAGLIVLKENKLPVLYEKDFLQTRKFIKTIAQDKFGRYWLGGEYLLNIFDGNEFIEYPNEQFEYNHGAISIFKDHNENLWLGTMAGLFFFDYKEFKRIRPDILDSQVASFVELDSSRLFMGINKGLALLDLEAFYNDSETNVKILNASNGFLGFDCIRNGILKDSDGNIWVAASDRVVKFYPDRLEQDTVPPAIVVTDLLATGLYSDYPTSFQHQANTDTIFELPYYLKNIRFNFHSIHFYAPEEISYKYKLAGYDENWSSPSNERYASYTNLAPGKYTFEVLAQNIDGIWSRQPAQIRFEIIPAFWQTFAFKMAINLLVIAIILTTIFLTMWILRLRKRKREETEKQISELQLKTIKSQMDPHFTFNALNSISSVIYKENKEKAYRYFTKFSKLVRASLEVSDKITRTLQEEVDFTRNYLDLEKIRFRDKFEFTINIDPKVNRELLVPKMVIQNYAENAVKHGLKYLEVNRQLKIAIDQIADHLQIMVEDNGVGRKQAQELKGFSTGKGLAIMNNIYDLYFKLYKIKIEQTIEDIYDSYGIPGGTKVIITIPISRK